MNDITASLTESVIMKRVLFLVAVLLTAAFAAKATHNRAGEIYFRQISFLSYEATIVTYTKESAPEDRPTLPIDWGDGTTDTLERFNGPIVNGTPYGVTIGKDIKVNKYRGTHTYNGVPPEGFYKVSMTNPNRISNIVNIANSVGVPFFIEDTLRIYNPSSFGQNNSPRLLEPPIDFANKNDTFRHNPNAYDPDGDSLSFHLIPPRAGPVTEVPGYDYPDEVLPGPDNNFTIDENTGQIVWAVPKKKGIYNIAILVQEFRDGIPMGSLVRDMQIIVEEQPNDPPRIADVKDTCIIAGSSLEEEVRAADPDSTQSVTISASGGPFNVDGNQAQFPEQSGIGSVTSTFSWDTECQHIREEPYQVVFKAEDDYTSPNGNAIPLTDLETWQITVVAPPPELTSVEPNSGNIDLEWNANYPCDDIEEFTGFSVWRRNGPNPFTPDTCDRGLEGKGYTKIAEGLENFTYTDTSVQKGQYYCYRIVADFAGIQTQNNVSNNPNYFNETESLPSNELCAELRRDLPVITNASVRSTSPSNGRVYVAWTKPLTTGDNLDTLQDPGPYKFALMRGEGQSFNNPTEVFSSTSQYFGTLNDTTYIDTLLDTKNQAYSYKVAFFTDGGEKMGESEVASTVFLNIAATDNQLELSWDASVPWENYQFGIFKRDNNTGNFEPVDTVQTSTYVDSGLTNGVEYCYFVESFGTYSSPTLPETLLNLSQKNCKKPLDTIPPCNPDLSVKNFCRKIQQESKTSCELSGEELSNNLSWRVESDECLEDILKYEIYFKSPSDSTAKLIQTINDPFDTTYTHFLDESIAGCYKVVAVDSFENKSQNPQEECIDNCPCYLLPNSFTPNGDGSNDLYTPFMPYRFIDKVNFRVYNQWGNLIYQTNNPDLNWDGTNMNNGKDVTEGTYYYTCEVYEQRVNGVKKREEPLSGYIELIRGK